MTRLSSDGRVHVLHLDHSVEAGGAELALRRLVANNEYWDPSVLTPKEDGRSVFEGLPGYGQVGPPQGAGASNTSAIGAIRFALRIATAAIALRKSAQFRRADIIHANTSRSAVYATLACLGSRTPVVVHVRDVVSAMGMGRLGAAIMHRFVLPRSAAVIASSQTCLESVSRSLKATTQAVVIPSPAGLRKVDSTPVRPDVLQIGMVARLAEWKGQLLLLRAFARAFPDSQVILRYAGTAMFDDEWYAAKLRSTVIELGLEGRVVFEGHVDDVPLFLEDIDIAVHSSIRPEPLGQNVLQYLSAGKPTIVSGEGGPVEWIESGKNGLAFEPRNEADLARVLQELATDRDLRKRLAEAAANTPGLLSDEESQVAHFAVFSRVQDHRVPPLGERR